MTTAPAGLEALLTLEPDGPDRWKAPNPPAGRPTIFGGQVAAQAVVAAAATVADDRPVHSLHAAFLRGGRPAQEMILEVDRVHDGRSFATRTVLARQEDHVVFDASVSFHREEDSATVMRPFPAVPGPEECPEMPRGQDAEQVVELRAISPSSDYSPLGEVRAWVRARPALADGATLHVAALVYMSDMHTGMSVAPQLGGFGGIGMVASLDHAVWVHGPFRADEWLLMGSETLAYGRSRALVLGRFHTQDGRAVATFAQELVMRPARDGTAEPATG
jgi:acyl-CoA thioesterase-2